MLIEVAREKMINQQVRAWDVLDEGVLGIMRSVPRERFVPPQYAELAFADTEIPLGHGERMLAPKVVGRILQAIEPATTDSALEVGTGSGFLTACLAARCRSVRSLEIHHDLADAARERLRSAGAGNAEVLAADAYATGALGERDYDVIVVTGSLPVEDPRFEQRLAIGGRLFVVVGEPPVMEARLVRRVGAAQWSTESLFETSLRALSGALRREGFRF